MEIRVVRDTVSREELTEFAKQQFFDDMTKAVVESLTYEKPLLGLSPGW